MSPLTPVAEKDYDNPPSPISRRLTRASISTTFSDSHSTEWFDAQEGVEEFELEQDEPEPSKIVIDDSKSSLEETASVDTDISIAELGEGEDNVHIVRRNQLPAPVVADEGSLFAILKKNVGKVTSRDIGETAPYLISANVGPCDYPVPGDI
jgi:oxysterol-binding protein-related protein 3/6/7